MGRSHDVFFETPLSKSSLILVLQFNHDRSQLLEEFWQRCLSALTKAQHACWGENIMYNKSNKLLFTFFQLVVHHLLWQMEKMLTFLLHHQTDGVSSCQGDSNHTDFPVTKMMWKKTKELSCGDTEASSHSERKEGRSRGEGGSRRETKPVKC